VRSLNGGSLELAQVRCENRTEGDAPDRGPIKHKRKYAPVRGKGQRASAPWRLSTTGEARAATARKIFPHPLTRNSRRLPIDLERRTSIPLLFSRVGRCDRSL
jgi:hypothetical protein